MAIEAMAFFRPIFNPTKWKRYLFFLLADITLITLSFYVAFYLRFGFTFPDKYRPLLFWWLVALIVLKVVCLFLAGLYNINWRFVGLRELMNLC
jgi:FlaA1/EpsC-like NDP-sugar epimerase